MTDPLLLKIPEELQTERLVLRAPQTEMSAVVTAAIGESLETLRQWMPWAQTAPTLEETERNLRKSLARFHLREILAYFIFRKSDDAFTGSVALQNIRWEVPRFEVGYWQRTSMGGRGYTTEAVRTLTDFAFHELDAARLELFTDQRNIPSIHVAERAGYILEARIRNDKRDVEGQLCDTLMYALLPDEWRSRNAP